MNESERRLLHSWQTNARGWIDVVREQRIDSRRLVTDAAMLDAALALHPQRALDIGCGEGWLCRALSAHGVQMVGVDAQPLLIDAARLAGGGQFHVCRHADLCAAHLGRFDLLLCNFALLEEQLQPLLHGWHDLLQPGGRLLIQTLHPRSACGEQDYRDGWRLEHFTSMGAGFAEPMPWYFRTLESWLALVAAAGWQLVARSEPPHPRSGIPASLLLELARPESG
ncbi:class I SAM-dependent methyltransferase [Pseudomonas sp. BMS12]|uniref:class I SAM-dependent methyltransferase n=1 Tax=Pseudomonas sp. BMS12 TaxID=1796033 RepID=UPI00083B158A|nr:methyltransferase domain-containing protein [Pseudomonas sp. BMS12]